MPCTPDCRRPRWFPGNYVLRPWQCPDCRTKWYAHRVWNGGWRRSVYVWRTRPVSPFMP